MYEFHAAGLATCSHRNFRPVQMRRFGQLPYAITIVRTRVLFRDALFWSLDPPAHGLAPACLCRRICKICTIGEISNLDTGRGGGSALSRLNRPSPGPTRPTVRTPQLRYGRTARVNLAGLHHLAPHGPSLGSLLTNPIDMSLGFADHDGLGFCIKEPFLLIWALEWVLLRPLASKRTLKEGQQGLQSPDFGIF